MAEPEEEATDPLVYLTAHASEAVDSTKMMASIALQARSGALLVSDAEVLVGIIQSRAQAGSLLFQALQRDARLPEGVRVLLAELAITQEAVAAVMVWGIGRGR